MISLISVALALTCPNGTDSSGACILKDSLGGGAGDLITILDSITNWLFTILLVLAVTFIIIAAYKYLASGGGEEVGKAHKMLVYAAVAVAVAVLAKGVVNVTKVLVGGGSGSSSSTTTSPPQLVNLATSPDEVSVMPCRGGDTSVVTVDGNEYGGSPIGKNLVFINDDPEISVEKCADGTIPPVEVNGNRYQ